MSSFKRIRDGVGGRSVESRRFRRHCFSCRSFNELNEPPRRFRERVRTERQRMPVPRYVPMNQRNSSFLVEISLPFSISWDARLPVYLRELVVHLFLPLFPSRGLLFPPLFRPNSWTFAQALPRPYLLYFPTKV